MDSDLEPVALTPQKQDSAWKHCEVYKYGDRVQMRCLYCRKMFKGGGITRVKEHLAGKKGQGTICDQVPEEVRLYLQQCIDGTVRRQRKRRKSSPEPLPIAYFPPCEVETQVVAPSDVNNGFKSPSSDVVAGQSTGRTKQRTYRSRKNVERNDLANVEVGGVSNMSDLIDRDMDNLIPVAISSVKNIVHPSSKDREKTVHMAMGRFLFDIGADFDAANSVNFQTFIDSIVSGGFGVSIPTHEDLRGWILKSCVEEVKKEIDECKTLWKRTGCSVLVQELNSNEGPMILKFLVYCPEKVVFLKSVDASEILDSEDKLYELLKEVVEEIGDTNVVQVITKCEDHYAAAGKKLMDVYPSLYWVPCAAHCIDKMLEEFGKMDWIREIIEQARTVTRIIYNHSGVLNLVRKFTYGNDIVQPAFTSSATNFTTMGRIADLKPHLQAMVTSSEWNDCSYSKEAGGLAMTETINDENFWKALTLANHISAPILRVLRIVCSERKPAMGYVYAAVYRAKEAIKTHLVHREDYIVYWKIIDRWWLQQPLHAAGFYLNPKFFYSIDEEMRSEIHLAVVDCIEKLVPDVNIQDIVIKDINSYKNAVGIFGRNLAIRARDTMLPAEWWSTYGESCLNLSRFAIRILSQTCSSSIGSGRNLTLISQIYESKNSIERQRLSDLVFVQYNMRLRRLGSESSGDDTVDPLSHSNMEVLEDWVSRNQVCIEGNGSSDWKSLEFIKRAEEVAVVIDETEDLGSDIFKGEKEASYEGGYSENLFT
ncbi:uncharacterized protein LOC110229901 isoform X1 [Arabidopsis lyrata subsp. lyrata]|uniref:uncharacterized protein LOC110229901 isoform X1 n=1 Tax=Arabidopsis lyrata subsp. lyrata TaxID=81972 RepID=UPI000A29D1EE|nr:uncharacterized protein LOC110229901 isoform X1 [Arabidopsis lyrata subsp. lyrata]|eukprot:XP_020886690.1 uncharacterized protein LOC110229901 isoform X1 [Arabidopsis lyrata subsp. lyrata]